MNLELSNLTPEIRAAIAAIATLGSAPVTLRETVILETSDETIGALLKKVLVNHLVGGPGQAHPKTAMLASATPPPANRQPRACERCGQTFQPKRKDQKFCTSPSCKMSKPAPAEVPTETSPLAPSSTPTAPGDTITWTIVDGPQAGAVLTPGELSNWIATDHPVYRKVMYSTRGLHQILSADDGQYLVAKPLPESDPAKAVSQGQS